MKSQRRVISSFSEARNVGIFIGLGKSNMEEKTEGTGERGDN
jgi:hypothetical protein